MDNLNRKMLLASGPHPWASAMRPPTRLLPDLTLATAANERSKQRGDELSAGNRSNMQGTLGQSGVPGAGPGRSVQAVHGSPPEMTPPSAFQGIRRLVQDLLLPSGAVALTAGWT